MPPPSQVIPEQGQSRSAQFISATIPAGETRQFNVSGNYYYFFEADGPVIVKTDLGSNKRLSVGTGEIVPPGSFFRFLELYNDGAADVDILLYAGFGIPVDNRLNIVRERPLQIQPVTEALSEAAGAGITSIAAATAVSYAPSLTGNRIMRRSITVSNLDNALNLYIRDASGNPIGCIFPQTAQVYFVSEEVDVYNPDLVSAVDCFIGEIYYIEN